MNLEKQGDKFIEYTEGFEKKLHLIQLKRECYKSMEKMGQLLYEIFMDYRDKPDHAVNAYGFESFRALLAAPEDSGGIDFSTQTAYQMVRVYETYVVNLQLRHAIQNTDYTKLDIMIPVITEDNKDEWFDKAKALARSDLRKEVHEALGKEVEEDACETVFQCKYCGRFNRLK